MFCVWLGSSAPGASAPDADEFIVVVAGETGEVDLTCVRLAGDVAMKITVSLLRPLNPSTVNCVIPSACTICSPILNNGCIARRCFACGLAAPRRERVHQMPTSL
mmetsp:Transcript_42917/g.137986  ORF Transcript_42917/g.137986 Transcript_42917/m.137986 type:complete len:105 (+) Transcript_42917:117-431(+)